MTTDAWVAFAASYSISGYNGPMNGGPKKTPLETESEGG